MKGQGDGSVEELPSGSHRASFRAPNGTRQRKTFRTEKQALKWLAAQQTDVARGVWQAPKDPAPTLKAYAERWIPERRNRKGQPLRPRTRAEYTRCLATDLADLADRPIDTLTPADVRSWYVTLDDRPAAQANAYGLLRAILGTAVEDELIERNPCRIRGGSSKDRASETEVLAPAEVDALAAKMPPHLRALVYVAAYTALRQGEQFELRRRDVDADGQAVTVRQAVTFTKGEVHVGDPKSAAGRRTVAVPPHMVPILLSHLRLWTGPDPDALVFTSSTGSRLRVSTLYHWFYPAREAIKRPDLRWHDLRHTGATLAAQSGATLAELQRRIGHSTAAAAMIYQHATDERDKLLAARISEAAAHPRLRAVP